MWENVHQVLAPEDSPPSAHGGEAIRLQVALLRVEVLQVGRTLPARPLPFRNQAVFVLHLREKVLPVRPPNQAWEDTHEEAEDRSDSYFLPGDYESATLAALEEVPRFADGTVLIEYVFYIFKTDYPASPISCLNI